MTRRPGLHRCVVVAALVALACAGCNGDDAAPSASGSGGATGGSGATGGTSSATTPVTPQIADQDGFQRINVLPAPVASVDVSDSSVDPTVRARAEVLRVEKVGAVVRVLVAWDRPTGGDAARAVAMRSVRAPEGDEYEIGLRLYDPQAQTLAEPLRTSDGRCLCSTNTQELVLATQQGLYWADFPAPASPTVTLLMGRALVPVEDVPVTDAQEPLQLPEALIEWGDGPPPPTPGEGAGAPTVHPVRRTVQGYGGAEETQVGDQAEISLPSDVLFPLDKANLTAAAKRVVTAAGPKLAKAAKGKTVQVVGHTDDQGTAAYNQDLSLRRAKAVVAALTPSVRSAGIKLVASGKGETDHLVPNFTADDKPIPENRQRNRRVTFVFDRARSEGGSRVGVDTPKPLPKMVLAQRTTASPKVTGAIASVLSTDRQVRLDVTRVQRRGEDLAVAMSFTSTGAKGNWGATSKVLGPNPFGTNGTLTNVRLVDGARRTIAPPLSYDKGACLCTEELGAGTVFEDPLTLWAVFPAPPATTTKVTLRVPGVGQVVDVPIA